MSTIAQLTPEPAETELAATALRGLAEALGSDVPIQVGNSHGSVEVPRAALTALTKILDSFAHGQAVTVVPSSAELTTQQAADLLNVSRPFLIRLLDSEQITHRMVGSHRRSDAASLIHYLRNDNVRRTDAADTLAAETVELELT